MSVATRRGIRFFAAVAAAGVFAGRLAACGDDFADPGVVMSMDGSMACMGACLGVIPGPSLFVVGTQAGKETLSALSLPDGARTTVPFRLMIPCGQMVLGNGLEPGSAQGIVVDPERKYAYFTLTSPPRLAIFTATGTMQCVRSPWLGAINDEVSRPALSADGTAVYAANSTAHKLFKVSATLGDVEASVSSAEVPSLVNPSSVAVTFDGKILVAVGSAAQASVLAFEDSGKLEVRAGLGVPLVAGSERGVDRAACTVVPGQSVLYCASPLASTSSSSVWRVQPGAAAMVAVRGLGSVPLLAVSPRGERLYVADGSVLRAYWIREGASQPPSPTGFVDLGGPIYDLTVTDDGAWVYASVPADDAVARVSAIDMTLERRYKNLDRPGPVFFSSPLPR